MLSIIKAREMGRPIFMNSANSMEKVVRVKSCLFYKANALSVVIFIEKINGSPA